MLNQGEFIDLGHSPGLLDSISGKDPRKWGTRTVRVALSSNIHTK